MQTSATQRFLARGTEPFWAVETSDEALNWKTPDKPDGVSLPARRQPTLQGWRWAGEKDGHTYSLGILHGECSDGMSDQRYEFTATWIYDEVQHTGCAQSLD